MAEFLRVIIDFFFGIQAMGAVLFVPVVIFITGICFGLNWKKSSRAAITVGIGFIGVDLVLGIVWDKLGPVTREIVERFGLQLEVLDISWTSAAAVSFTTIIGVIIIPFVLLLNVICLFLRLTKTMNIDIWNYWHFALTGSLVNLLSGSLWLGLLATACHVVIILQFADITAGAVQRELRIPGVSIPHGNSAALVPLYLLLDKLYDRIPGFAIKDNAKDMTDKPFWRWLADPVVMGFIIGLCLGLLAGRTGFDCASIAMHMAALMLLLPRMVKVIMEGLIPVSQATKHFADRRMRGRVIHIGLDSAVTLGHPTTLSASMMLIPITLGLAFILPGNRTIPVGDLVTISFFIALATPIHRGNLRRTMVSGVITCGIMLLVCSAFAPAFTQLVYAHGDMTLPTQTTLVSAMAVGDPVMWCLNALSSLPIFIGPLLMVGATVAVVVLCKLWEKRMEQTVPSKRTSEII